MGFEQLLGNQRLKENLRAGIGRGKISHFYLISGPQGSGKKTLARLLAAAILCREGNKPCLFCPVCRKVMDDTHPDFITVTDPEHKNVAVSIVRRIREDMFVRPNEADKKIYLFPQPMGIEGQNALLKILEEPPSYGVFILLANNPELLLTTVRSRATELRLSTLTREELEPALRRQFPQVEEETLLAAMERSGGYLGQALQLMEMGNVVSPQTQCFVQSFSHKDGVGLLNALVPMEKWKRDQLVEELRCWAELVQQALVFRSGGQVLSRIARELGSQRSSQELLQALRHIQKAMEYAQSNVSAGAVCGFLVWALR